MPNTTLLSDGDLATMRATLNQSLPGTAVIQSATFTDNAGGGGSVAWSAAGTVACRISSMGGDERLIAGRLAENANWMVTLPALTTIDGGDRLIIDGVPYNVLAMHAPRSFELSRRIEVNEVT